MNDVNYSCNFNRITKSQAANLFQNADLTEEVERYKNIFCYLYIKMDKKLLKFGETEIGLFLLKSIISLLGGVAGVRTLSMFIVS